MKLLVTGGAGFIGSHYVRTLLGGGFGERSDADTHVTVLDLLTYAGNRANLPAHHPRMRFVPGDIGDLPLLLALLPGHDAVVHFAAETHVDRSLAPDAAPGFVRTNVLGTQTLLDACLRTGVGRMVHISTDEVYGSIAHGAWTEDQPPAPRSPYAASKAGADLLVLACHHTHGLNVSITRCCNNYGPYQHPEKLIPRFVTRLLEGRELPLYGDGCHVREWLHVDDHCRAVHRVLHHGRAGEIYHVGGGSAHTNLALTGHLLRLCGADWSSVRRVADRKGHDRRYALDATKIRTELGHTPRTGFDRGLADTVAWYRAHPEWWKETAHR